MTIVFIYYWQLEYTPFTPPLAPPPLAHGLLETRRQAGIPLSPPHIEILRYAYLRRHISEYLFITATPRRQAETPPDTYIEIAASPMLRHAAIGHYY